MKTLVQTSKAAVVMMSLALLSACGQSGSAISTSSNNPGAGAIGKGVDIKSCQVGQAYSSEFGCLTRGSCRIGTGLMPQVNQQIQSTQCIQGQAVTEELKYGSSAGTRHFGRLEITNTQQASLLLQSAGLCNAGFGGSMFGSAMMGSCTQLINRGGFSIVKSFIGDNINMMIGFGTTFPADQVQIFPGMAPAYMMQGGSNYLSFSQQSRSYKYNNGNGMQIVGISPTGSTVNLMMIVDNGSLGSNRIEKAKLIYQGVEFAKISLDRF